MSERSSSVWRGAVAPLLAGTTLTVAGYTGGYIHEASQHNTAPTPQTQNQEYSQGPEATFDEDKPSTWTDAQLGIQLQFMSSQDCYQRQGQSTELKEEYTQLYRKIANVISNRLERDSTPLVEFEANGMDLVKSGLPNSYDEFLDRQCE